jgi:hypothetical protein
VHSFVSQREGELTASGEVTIAGDDDDHERDEGMIEKSGFGIWGFTKWAWERLTHCMHGYGRPATVLVEPSVFLGNST